MKYKSRPPVQISNLVFVHQTNMFRFLGKNYIEKKTLIFKYILIVIHLSKECPRVKQDTTSTIDFVSKYVKLVFVHLPSILLAWT